MMHEKNVQALRVVICSTNTEAIDENSMPVKLQHQFYLHHQALFCIYHRDALTMTIALEEPTHVQRVNANVARRKDARIR